MHTDVCRLAAWLAEDSGGGLYAYKEKPYNDCGSWQSLDGYMEYIAELEDEKIVEIE